MLQKASLNFLKNLKANNNKLWFDAHKHNYLATKKDFENFVQQLLASFSSFDNSLKELAPKHCTFRINRDIRFSKDKTPYKANMGASFARGGKKSLFAGYYFHMEPGGKSFAGGGLWMPQAPELKKLRQEIDYCFADFKKLTASPAFKKQYSSGLEMNKNNTLVNIPKGYEKDNPAANFLKLKSFVAVKTLTDSQLTSASLLTDVVDAFKALMPLIQFMNRAME